MATQVTNYQCPACTGPLHYAGDSGKLECEYCGSAYDVAEIEKLYAGKEDAAETQATAAQAAEAEELGEDQGEYAANGESWEPEGMKAYSCPSCGAELVCDETTVATSCPYCGNPSIVPGQFAGMRKPDYVLPFKLDKKAAEEALRKYYKGKKLLPRAFSAENHIQEIKGVYVPFWLYDGEADADVSYAATRVFTTTRGNERITTTEHYQVRRAGTVRFEGIPTFAPEHFSVISQVDTMKRKQFVKGVTQIAQEGAIQIFHEPNSGMEEVIVGAVGVLQFEVLEYRLRNEYNIDIRRRDLSYSYIRWITSEGTDPTALNLASDTKWVQDFRGHNLLIFNNEWSIRWAEQKNPGLELAEFSRNW